jgi:hypothetical protein
MGFKFLYMSWKFPMTQRIGSGNLVSLNRVESFEWQEGDGKTLQAPGGQLASSRARH